MTTQFNVRLPDVVIDDINYLSTKYGSQSKAIIAAVTNLATEFKTKERMIGMKLYYCPAGGHLWYYGDDGTPLFYKNLGDATDEEVETAEEKYCGCND
jgi:hypothetical protein